MADNITRALSDPKVRNAKPEAKPKKLTDGGGLYLLVQPNGAKLWRYKFRLGGKEQLHALGAYPEVSLADARRNHEAARALVAAGESPVKARQTERERATRDELVAKAGSFEAVMASWRKLTDPKLAPASIKQRGYETTRYLAPAFKGKSVQQIDRVAIASLLNGVESRAPEVARNLRNYLSAIFEHAIDIGLVTANPTPPPRALARRRQVSHAAMATDRLPEFLTSLDDCGANRETRIALELVILMVTRKSEVTGARWSEFDLDAAAWTVPAERMKARREHWVPLSPAAVDLLRELRTLSPGAFLFPHRNKPDAPMNERTLNAMMERNGFAGETVHGFRSVFSTHFNKAGANPDVIERCLAHAPADKVRAAYNRHDYQDERRELLGQWAAYIAGQRLRFKRAA